VRIDGQTTTLRLTDLYAPIADDMQAARRILADELATDQPLIDDTCRHVSQYHGKMLRPALLLLAAQATGGVRPAHHTLAAVVELVHLATLVHDDILDEAGIRRRAATVNRLWGNQHAVLMGDFLYSHAFHLCSSLPSPHAARLIGQTAVTTCEGEMLQVASRGNFSLAERDYLDIIARKTAALVETCCHLGAHYADADPATVRSLRQFGHNVGVAFQIVDDLLDLTGREAEVGKSVGRDVAEGELTLPLIHYLRSQPDGEPGRLVELLRAADPSQHSQIAHLLVESNSLAYAESIAREHIESAKAALAVLPPTPARERLSALADFVIDRRQ
jgi:octaprenyl-diphosphate synthase